VVKVASAQILGAENVIVPKLSELIIGTISFGVLVAFFFWKIYPQIKRVYAERTERIEGGIERADGAQREAQALLTEYRQQLADARADATRIREEARDQGRAITEELRAAAQREVAEIKVRAEEQLAADRAQAVAQLRREVGELAVELASRVIGQELESNERQRRLVEDFLTTLDASPDSAAAPVGGRS
jgi:F-type H+-transporting ATPase subunit b